MVSDAHAAVDALLDAVTELEACDLEVLGDVDALVSKLSQALDRVGSVSAQLVSRVGERGNWAADGRFTSAAAWLRAISRRDHGEAKRQLADGQWLGTQPELREAITQGRIGMGHVSAMRPFMTRTPLHESMFSACVDDIVLVAEHLPPAKFGQYAKTWATALDDEDETDEVARRTYQRRQVKLSQTSDGWHLSGFLPNLMGSQVSAALNAIMVDSYRSGSDVKGTPAPQRRADALHELAQSYLAHQPESRKVKAQTIVTIPATMLTGQSPDPDTMRLPDLEALVATWRTGNGPGHGPLTPADMRLATCDTDVQRLILGAESMPLDIGRSTRQIPRHMLNALIVRDGGCAFPSCQRVPAHCEAHHIVHWSRGGSTSMDNLLLLCSRHHHEIHHDKAQWHVHAPPGRPPSIVRREAHRTTQAA